MILSMIVFIRFTLIVITPSSYMVMPQSSGHVQMVVEVPNIPMVTLLVPDAQFKRTPGQSCPKMNDLVTRY